MRSIALSVIRYSCPSLSLSRSTALGLGLVLSLSACGDEGERNDSNDSEQQMVVLMDEEPLYPVVDPLNTIVDESLLTIADGSLDSDESSSTENTPSSDDTLADETASDENVEDQSSDTQVQSTIVTGEAYGCAASDGPDAPRGGSQLVWDSRCLVEAGADNGSIVRKIQATLEGADFATSYFEEGVHYEINNLPSGLYLIVQLDDENRLTVQAKGNASSHDDSDDVGDFGIEFSDAAFVGGGADEIAGAEGEQLGVDFWGGRDGEHSTFDASDSCEVQPFALVEFFCTTACSSCPGPFEEWNSVFANNDGYIGDNVVTIMENYNEWSAETDWWKDPYGQDVFQDRYDTYRGVQGSASVDGTQDFDLVGIDGKTTFDFEDAWSGYVLATDDIKARIDDALEKDAEVGVCLTVDEVDHAAGKIRVEYSLGGNYEGKRLNIAVVEDGLDVEVWAGAKFELAPGTYHHDGLARVLESYELGSDSGGVVEFYVPGDVDYSNSRVVAFVDDVDSFEVLGATAGVELD